MKTSTELTREDYSSYVEKGIDFYSYINQLVDLVLTIKSGEGDDIQYGEYMPINLQRLKRGMKQAKPSETLESIARNLEQPVDWLVLTEQWCGDAAQSLAYINAVAEASEGKIKLSLLYRDENPELMNQHLTNGGRSIPKLIQLNESKEVTATWGPRPDEIQEVVLNLRKSGEPYTETLHTWYAKDKNESLDKELQQILSQA